MFPFFFSSTTNDEYIEALLEAQRREGYSDEQIQVTSSLMCMECGDSLDRDLSFIVTGFNQCYHIKETCLTSMIQMESKRLKGGFFKKGS